MSHVGNMQELCLKEIRIAKGYSQSKLAKISGLSRSAIVFIEDGEKSPTLNTLRKISNALGVSVSQIIGETDFRLEERAM